VSSPKNKIGILAFGSLITEPGPELEEKLVLRIKTRTPFGVEYGRYSRNTRGGAPTLVPHEVGSPVAGEILVLHNTVTVEDARDMLWRRERGKVGSGETYTEGSTADSVLVRQIIDSPYAITLLFTDFWPAGKIDMPNPEHLAKHAIKSVKKAACGKDGITYLTTNIAVGIKTLLTSAYQAEILKQTNAHSLHEALERAKAL
jgi:hypothetical protein